MKMKKIIKSNLKHTADLVTPAGEIIPCEVRKISHYSEFLPDLLWISLVSQRPIGRHIELWKKGYKFHWLED
jgi:hypothetical protein